MRGSKLIFPLSTPLEGREVEPSLFLVPIVTDEPSLHIRSDEAYAGKTIALHFDIESNPGVMYLRE